MPLSSSALASGEVRRLVPLGDASAQQLSGSTPDSPSTRLRRAPTLVFRRARPWGRLGPSPDLSWRMS